MVSLAFPFSPPHFYGIHLGAIRDIPDADATHTAQALLFRRQLPLL